MHGEHDALPVVANNGDSSLFAAATLAALVLAGSALVYRKTYEQQPKRGKLTQPSEQSTPDDMDTEKHQPLDARDYADGSSSAHDQDSKESKSSRSKDRRRRGKDPLKEIFKGGKKLKSTPPTLVKQSLTDKPIIDDLDNNHLNNINNIPNPASPTPSFTSNGTSNSFSRRSGKRAQRDGNMPADNTSGHSRTTSEVSQSNTGSRSHQHTPNRTPSTSISEDHVLTPSHFPSSPTEDDISISKGQHPDTLPRPARETHLATPIFSTIQNNDDFSEIVNHSVPYSSSASSTTNTTTASCVITPATSPSLSFTSSKLVSAPSPVRVNSELAPNYNGSDCGPKNNPESEPSHAPDTDTNISRKHQQIPTPSKSKSKTKANAPNSWEWDSLGELVSAPLSSPISASVIASATPTSALITAPAFPPEMVYRKPPRLQPKSLWSKNAKNDASSLIPGSVSHPSMLSPTSGSFVDSPLLSPSLSSSLEKISSRVSKVVEESEGDESEEERDTPDDSYSQLEFPTLNPTVSNSSSLASNSNGGATASSSAASPSHTHRSAPQRAHGSRRPPTPSGTLTSASSASGSGSGSAQPPTTQVPAVSTQTQLASLRGALEAARLREEKNKAVMERCTKDLEVLRWENANLRRGEVELQNHIGYLMHQLHMYTSLFASVSPLATSLQQPQQPQQTQGLGDRATSGPGSANGPTTTSNPGTQDVQSPAAAVIPGPPVSSPGPMNLNTLPPLQLNGLSSPRSATAVFPPPIPSMHVPSHYFPYPMHPPPSHPHAAMPSPHPVFAQQFHHMHQQFLQFQQYQQHQPHMPNQSPTIQAQQTMLHTPATSSHQPYAASSSSKASGSRSSSRRGTDSAESMSPDLNGSLSPVLGTKRRRTRARTRTNGYAGGRTDTTDSWVAGGVSIDEGDERGHESIHEHEEQEENGDEDEGGFNEILADAIFKRPASLGVRSGKKKQALLKIELEQLENEVLDGVEPLTEFKFPSLSNMGNVVGGYNQSSSSLPVVVSPALEDLGQNGQMLADGPPQDIVHIEAAVSHNASSTASSSPESARTPRREGSEPNVTEPLSEAKGGN